jgi:choline-sulfatase
MKQPTELTRRGFVGLAAGPWLITRSGAGSTQQAKTSGTPPNILLIMADQMTPFMTAPYGQRVARTPNLDRLARNGTVLENAYCNSPLCVPSRTSMFTGRLPAPIESYDNASEFAARRPTFVHYLRRAGYRTAVAGKCHFIGPDQLHGFDERLTPCIFPADMTMLPDWRRGPVYNKGTSIQSMLRMLGPSKTTRQIEFDENVFQRSMARLREYGLGKREQPLFLNVSFTQPHDPFTTTQEFLDLYKDAAIPMPADYGDIRRLSPTYEWFIIHHGLDKETLPPEKIREARRNYLGMISWVDDKVGRILDELARLGMHRDTVVIFTSDHGEMLGEHGQWSKRLMLEWSSRVPLIVSGTDRVPAGKRVPAPVSLLDLFPTLAELAGSPVETQVDGRSLLPLLAGAEDGSRPEVVAEYLGEGPIEPIRMVRQGSHKYITVNGYAPQLFDLAKDPNETTNLAGNRQYAAFEKRLRARAEQDWDGPALKRAVLASQRERAIIMSLREHGGRPRWDYEPPKPA